MLFHNICTFIQSVFYFCTCCINRFSRNIACRPIRSFSVLQFFNANSNLPRRLHLFLLPSWYFRQFSRYQFSYVLFPSKISSLLSNIFPFSTIIILLPFLFSSKKHFTDLDALSFSHYILIFASPRLISVACLPLY